MRRLKPAASSAVAVVFAVLCLLMSAQPGAAQQPQPQRRQEQPDRTIDAAERARVIDNLLKRLNDHYVFPEVAAAIEKDVRGRASKGEYDAITSARTLASTLTSHVQAVSKDKHMRVRYSYDPLPPQGGLRREMTAEERERMRREAARLNHGFERVERLPGNIGYMELRGFMNPELAADTVASAMNFLSNTDALIIDLRRNGGGTPQMVQLVCSYLFGGEPVHLNDIYRREDGRTQEFWTLKSVPGKRYEGKDVYVLTSNFTFSGAEEFAYNLKNLKRAIIVGETTGGGANPGGIFPLSENFGVFVPTGRAISPVTRTNWEGTGVEPDVKVSAEQALKTAHLSAVKKQLEKTTDAEFKGQLQMLVEDLQKELGGARSEK